MQNILSDKRSSLSIWFFILSWVVYAGLYVALKSHGATAGALELVIDNGFNLVLVTFFFILWSKVEKGNPAKRIFLFFALAYCFAAISGSTCQTIYNVLHLSRSAVSGFWVSVYSVSYIVYALFQLLAWSSILLAIKIGTKKTNFIYFPIVLMFVVVFAICLYSIKLDTSTSSLTTIYDGAIKVLEIACVIVVIFSLSTAKAKGLFYLAIGLLIDKMCSMILDFGLFSQGFGLSSVLETGWVLGKLFMLYGLIDLVRTKLISDVRAWIAPPNSIRAQVAYWSFIISIFALVAFFVVAYLLNPKIFF